MCSRNFALAQHNRVWTPERSSPLSPSRAPTYIGTLAQQGNIGQGRQRASPICPFFPDLWVDDCSWAMTPEVLDRPVGLIHCLLQSTAFSDLGRGPSLSAADGGIHCAGPSLQQLPSQALGHRGSPWLPSEPDVRGRVQRARARARPPPALRTRSSRPLRPRSFPSSTNFSFWSCSTTRYALSCTRLFMHIGLFSRTLFCRTPCASSFAESSFTFLSFT